MSINLLITNVRLGVKYAYSQSKIKPTFELGVSNTFFLKRNRTTLTKILDQDEDNYGYPYTSKIKMPNYFIGGYASVGIDYPIGKQLLFLNAVYEISTSVSSPKNGDNSFQSPHIKAGITF